MIDIDLRNIVKLVESVLGKTRVEIDTDRWNEFCCPYCASYEGIESDGKYNCCLNFNEGFFHCWKCGNSGKISKILKDFGGSYVVSEYYEILNDIKNSKEYQFNQDNSLVKNELIDTDYGLKLPDNFKRISKEDKQSHQAYLYLKSRGLDYDIINDFKIGYVPWSDNFKMRNRVVIPSYDQYGNLNYYVTRDYTGKQKLKYINPTIDKKTVIFNEGKINWCENVTLCEGVFDSFVIPNSIPLLGKVINEDFAVYNEILEKARVNINILLDDDATDDAIQMYKFLNNGALRDRVRLIECPNGYDASLLYEKFGKKAIYRLMNSARKLEEYELL